MPNPRSAPPMLILIAALQACTSTAAPSVPATGASSAVAARRDAMSNSPLLYVSDEGGIVTSTRIRKESSSKSCP